MKKLEITQLGAELSQPIDLLIGCVSYEKRCLSIPVALEHSTIQQSVYFKIKEFEKASAANEAELKRIFKGKLEVVEYNNHKPIEFANYFIDTLSEVYASIGRALNVVFDMTTFTREALIMSIAMLFYNKDRFATVSLLYAPASQMSEEWLCRGFRSARSVLGFPGGRSSLKPLHVVVMTGFELERAKYIIDEYEPDLISVGVGKCTESIKPEFYNRNQKFVNDLITFYESRVNTFEFSLVDPMKTSNELCKYLEQYSAYNTVIAPMNNKISTVGTALYGLRHEDAQICYLPAEEYNFHNYSEPDNVVYLGKLELENL